MRFALVLPLFLSLPYEPSEPFRSGLRDISLLLKSWFITLCRNRSQREPPPPALVRWSAAGPAYTTLTVTSILPRVALEYAQVSPCVASTISWATSRSKPGKLTLSRARRK